MSVQKQILLYLPMPHVVRGFPAVLLPAKVVLPPYKLVPNTLVTMWLVLD